MATSLPTRSEEFRRVDYLLKLSLGSSSAASNVQVWHFDNPQQQAKFEIHNQNTPVIHAWLLEEQACDDLVQNQGSLLRFPQRFETGQISSPSKTATHNRRRGGDVQRLVLCQVAVGKCFVQDYAEAAGMGMEDLAQYRLPDGFDSILQSSPDDDPAAADNGEDAAVYHHEYVLFNSYQCLPMYLVQYESSSSSSSPRRRHRSNHDEDEQNVYDKYDFFDPVDYVPVSIRDKMVGSHSKGEAANHKLISLQDAYEIALKESEKPDLLLRQTVQEIKNQLRTVDSKLRDVNANSARVEEDLYKCLQDALFELQQLTQTRMQGLLSVEVELKRKLSHLEWAEQYLARQRVEAKPLDFLTVWKCHSQLRGDICHSEQQQQQDTAYALQQIQADMEFSGSIHVGQAGDRHHQQQLALLNNHNHNNARRGGAPAPARSSRRGSGSMVLNGGSPNGNNRRDQQQHDNDDDGDDRVVDDEEQPTLFLEDTAGVPPQPQAIIPQHTTTPPLPEPNLDVSKAFVEALRQQSRMKSDPYGDSKRRYGGQGGQSNPNSFLLQQEEVPPSPPPLYKRPPVAVPDMPPLSSSSTPAASSSRFAAFSIYEEACRKVRQMDKARRHEYVDWLHRSSPKFVESQLVSHAVTANAAAAASAAGAEDHYFALSQACQLFLTLPVKNVVQPQLLYSSRQVGTPRLRDLVAALPRQQQREVTPEGEEIVTETLVHCPTVLLIRANGNRVFGGFIADSFSLASGPFGTPRSFLFSLDQDVKIPFTGREALPPNKNLVAHCQANGLAVPKFATMFCDETKLQFGVGDLVLGYDLKQGSSELERSYGGLGLDSGGEALTFLCGAERFNCDEVELWKVSA